MIEKRWTSAEWIVVLGVIFSGLVGLINAYQGNGRDKALTKQSETLDTIETNTNSKLTDQNDLLKAMHAEITALKVQKAAAEAEQNKD